MYMHTDIYIYNLNIHIKTSYTIIIISSLLERLHVAPDWGQKKHEDLNQRHATI